MNCGEIEPLLGAYLDGELDLMHSLEVEAHLGGCGPCSRALDNQKQVARAVSAAARYPAPPGLRRRLAQPAMGRPGPGTHGNHARWLAIAAGLALASVAVWRLAPVQGGSGDRLEQEIVANHVRSLLADHLLDMPSSDRQRIQPWFGGKLDYAPSVEDISAQGFGLLGGRLDYLGGRTVAALVYQRQGHVINVFVWPAAGLADQPPVPRSAGGFTVVGWRAKGMNWWAVSDLSAASLEELPMCPCFMPPHPALQARDLGRIGIRPVSN